jgi:hypothetical protein
MVGVGCCSQAVLRSLDLQRRHRAPRGPAHRPAVAAASCRPGDQGADRPCACVCVYVWMRRPCSCSRRADAWAIPRWGGISQRGSCGGPLADWLKGPQIGLDGIVFGPCSTLLSFDCLSLMSRADCCGMPMRLVERVCVRCRIAPTLFDCSPSLHVHVRVARKAVGSRRSGAAQGWRDAANLRLSTFD